MKPGSQEDLADYIARILGVGRVCCTSKHPITALHELPYNLECLGSRSRAYGLLLVITQPPQNLRGHKLPTQRAVRFLLSASHDLTKYQANEIGGPLGRDTFSVGRIRRGPLCSLNFSKASCRWM